MANSPFTCNGCENRYHGCHDHCEKYKKEKAVWDKHKAELQVKKEANAYTKRSIISYSGKKKSRIYFGKFDQ